MAGGLGVVYGELNNEMDLERVCHFPRRHLPSSDNVTSPNGRFGTDDQTRGEIKVAFTDIIRRVAGAGRS